MSLAGEAIVSIWHDITDEGRDEFYWWHIHEHMPERVGIPGFLRGRRYIAEEGTPEIFTLYETETIDVASGSDYHERLNNPTPWTLKAVQHFRNVARCIQHVRFTAGPGMGGHLLTLQFEVDEPDGFAERLAAEVLVKIRDVQGVTGVHLGETDMAASDTRTKERDLREGEMLMPGWAILVEAARRDELDNVREAFLSPRHLGAVGVSSEIESAIYRLEYIRSKSDVVE